MKFGNAANSVSPIKFAPTEGPQVLSVAVRGANGKVAYKRIQPVMPIFFAGGKSGEEQWMLRAFDMADGQLHDFPMKDCDFTV